MSSPLPVAPLRRHPSAVVAVLAVLAALLAATLSVPAPADAGPRSDSGGWTRGEPPLETPWTDEVGPRNALPEYPRPQLVRDRWRNLNGVWQFAAAGPDDPAPLGQDLAERVLVPYPIESALSGIQRHEDFMYYRRTVTVPQRWHVGDTHRLMLHFGAVDYEASVWVDGRRVARHTGGYGAFSADVTDALERRGTTHEIVVGVEDRTDATWQPVGKQVLEPDRGIFYEPSSGIWQTVWMEPVPVRDVEDLDMVPDIDTDTLGLTVDSSRNVPRSTRVEAIVRDGGRTVSTTTGRPNRPMTLPVPRAKLWSPDRPHLYDLVVKVRQGRRGKVVDRVESYFGMREIGKVRGEDGKMRITLNGKPMFLMSTLDQGYWPDGLYTAPTDEALAFDLEQHKRLGFNTVRKHIKTEPDRWYYHADRLGLMVWQDMPSMRIGGDDPPPEAQAAFTRQLQELVEEKQDWTSIVGWIPFNEGWGEWDQAATGRIADLVKAQDPTRLVNAHSGVNCCFSEGDSGKGDVIDWHQYVGPATPTPEGDRVAIDGEHGGFGLEVEDHMWFGEGGAYEMTDSSEALTRRYVENQTDVLESVERCGVSGSIYTQITDVEHEVNGFFTYDRQVEKMDFDQVRAINEQIIAAGADPDTTPPEPEPGTPGTDGVHAYPFDEGTGATAEDTQGDADATLTNHEWVDGVDGGAVSFDGDGQADTGQQLIDTDDSSYSVSAWAKLDVADGGFQTVVSQDTGSASSFFLQYSGADQRWAFSFIGLRAISPEKPEVGRWYHLTGVRDAAAGTIALYVDGQQVAEQSACVAPGGEGSTVIGRGEFGGDQVDWLRGDVDDVRIFDRALSAAEVAGIATPPAGR